MDDRSVNAFLPRTRLSIKHVIALHRLHTLGRVCSPSFLLTGFVINLYSSPDKRDKYLAQ